MKRVYPWIVGGMLCLSGTRLQAKDAFIQLHCLSLRFQGATAKLAGQTFQLEMTGNAGDNAPNGELRFMPPDVPYTHGGYLLLYYPFDPTPVPLRFFLDVPLTEDANGNGLFDAFEVSQPLRGTTDGYYEDFAFGDSPIQATWTRAANSKNGACQLRLPVLGLTFTHTFEVIEYAGTLVYTNAGVNVTGTAQLAQAQNADNKLAGPLSLIKTNADLLPLASGSWSHSSGKILNYQVPYPVERDRTNYAAYLAFDDGEPATDGFDYQDWVLLIADWNDADGNGIPDLSDAAEPVRPVLSLTRTGTQFLARIEGQVGQSYTLEETASLAQPKWNRTLTITLPADFQELPLLFPADETHFWRLKTP